MEADTRTSAWEFMQTTIYSPGTYRVSLVRLLAVSLPLAGVLYWCTVALIYHFSGPWVRDSGFGEDIAALMAKPSSVVLGAFYGVGVPLVTAWLVRRSQLGKNAVGPLSAAAALLSSRQCPRVLQRSVLAHKRRSNRRTARLVRFAGGRIFICALGWLALGATTHLAVCWLVLARDWSHVFLRERHEHAQFVSYAGSRCVIFVRELYGFERHGRYGSVEEFASPNIPIRVETAPFWSGICSPGLDDGDLALEDAVGLPFPALACYVYGTEDANGLSVRRIKGSISSPDQIADIVGDAGLFPCHPLWAGLAIDSLAWAAGLFAVWGATVLGRWQVTRFVTQCRWHEGLCPVCGYRRFGQMRPVCPECGWGLEPGSGGAP